MLDMSLLTWHGPKVLNQNQEFFHEGCSMCESIEKGSLVMTPTGRPGIVEKIVYGERGDIPRAIIKYLDSENIEEEVRLPMDKFKTVGDIETARAVVRSMRL